MQDGLDLSSLLPEVYTAPDVTGALAGPLGASDCSDMGGKPGCGTGSKVN